MDDAEAAGPLQQQSEARNADGAAPGGALADALQMLLALDGERAAAEALAPALKPLAADGPDA
ncbi:MAG: hypothetical protein HC850_04400 [Rhodomicrobium sp.]|nr:hypothetical protein [Rhodomicrobium sp.]